MPQLYLVPTPVGNLEDMTFRAVRLLKEVDLILAEDTRVTGKLLRHFEIATPMQSYHQFNEHKVVSALVQQLEEGAVMALVTDAGTPGISDPGFLLVRACSERGVAVSCLPGATAFVPALVNSAIPSNRFFFEGFLPHKKGRRSRIEQLASLPHTLVLYESPYRLLKCLEQMAEVFGPGRRACVCREISKVYEESLRGTLAELAAHYTANPPKGEIVIVVEGYDPKAETPHDNHDH
ncbi:MAG: 16S rRNA (cytidine(1402)-2'-O)-methyltransferase [Bacteroidetes bacterium]|nr:MAG: 16S rRNA (cytidine(1402)-2'-O)-methyltransferase [Bacteroidota bacterium]